MAGVNSCRSEIEKREKKEEKILRIMKNDQTWSSFIATHELAGNPCSIGTRN